MSVLFCIASLYLSMFCPTTNTMMEQLYTLEQSYSWDPDATEQGYVNQLRMCRCLKGMEIIIITQYYFL